MSYRSRNKWLLLTVIVSSVVVPINGCRKNDSLTGPVAGREAPGPLPPLISNFGGLNPATVLTITRFSGIVHGIAAETVTGAARFGVPGTAQGTVKVTVGVTDFIFVKSGTSDITYSYEPSEGNPGGIRLDSLATPVTFHVSDYSLTKPSVTVPGRLSVTSPAASAVVSRTNPLTVLWTSREFPGSQSAVYLTDIAGRTLFKQNLGAVASGTFTAAELATVQPGTAYVGGISYNYVLADGDTAVLVGEATGFEVITLQ